MVHVLVMWADSVSFCDIMTDFLNHTLFWNQLVVACAVSAAAAIAATAAAGAVAAAAFTQRKATPRTPEMPLGVAAQSASARRPA